MRRIRVVLAVLAFVFVLASCGGGDSTSEDGDTSDSTASNDDGGSETSSGDGDDGGAAEEVEVDDFSIPFPAGVTSETLRVPGALQLFYAADDFDRIVMFYDDWTAAEPEDYERFERPETGSIEWVFLDDTGVLARFISVTPDFDGGANFGTVTYLQLLDDSGA